MKAHFFQHVAFEGLGNIETWLKQAGYEISGTQFFKDDSLPDIDDIDVLIVLGGPMSVYDEPEFPWLAAEKKFIRDYLRAEKPLLGICLGAQLIAHVLGGAVKKNHSKEIGWFPVEAVPSDNPIAFCFPEEFIAFHWHGETFGLPEQAIHLARSSACENQAFQIGQYVFGLQFHLEMTPHAIGQLIEHCHEELVDEAFVQSEVDMISAPTKCFSLIHTIMNDVLTFLHQASINKTN